MPHRGSGNYKDVMERFVQHETWYVNMIYLVFFLPDKTYSLNAHMLCVWARMGYVTLL